MRYGKEMEGVPARADETFDLLSYLLDELELELGLCPLGMRRSRMIREPGDKANHEPPEKDDKGNDNAPPPPHRTLLSSLSLFTSIQTHTSLALEPSTSISPPSRASNPLPRSQFSTSLANVAIPTLF